MKQQSGSHCLRSAAHTFQTTSALSFSSRTSRMDWAEAVDMAEKAKETVFKIDLKSCYALLLNYTDPTSPNPKEIISDGIWKVPKYNKILLDNFRFETESFVF